MSPDIAQLSSVLHRPLRPLWIDRSTPVPDTPSEYADLPFCPLLLVNPSPPTRPSAERGGWCHVQGAGDDEANWSRGLSPALFWTHARELLALTPLDCEQRVDELVKEAREEPSHTVDTAPVLLPVASTGLFLAYSTIAPDPEAQDEGSARLHLDVVRDKTTASALNRQRRQPAVPAASAPSSPTSTLVVAVSGVTKDKRALQDILPHCIAFIMQQRQRGRRVLVTGEDWTALTTVAIGALVSGWNERFEFVGQAGEGVMRPRVTKDLLRVVSAVVHGCVPDVFPTRLQLKQLNLFFLSPYQ